MSSPIPQFSPDTLKAIRKERGVSRTKLAATIDVSQETIVNWEQGLTRPRIDLLCAACAVLGCAITDVVKAEVAALLTDDDPASLGDPGRRSAVSLGTSTGSRVERARRVED